MKIVAIADTHDRCRELTLPDGDVLVHAGDRPRVHVFGHIHEGAGIYSNERTTFINASSCDRAYEPVNEPVVVEIGVRGGYAAR